MEYVYYGSLVLVACGAAFWWWVRRGIRRVARNILETQRAMCGSVHEYRVVDPAAYPDLDHDFYRRTTDWLIEQGFNLLGDLENVTLRAVMENDADGLAVKTRKTPFQRFLVSAEGDIVACIFHSISPAARREGGRLVIEEQHLRMLEFQTEFDDGTSVGTSLESPAALTEAMPEHRRHFMPADTPPEELLERHRAHVASVQAVWKNARPVAIRTLDDLLAGIRRDDEKRIAFRREIGWVTEKELLRIAGDNREAVAKAIMTEIRRIQAREAGG